MKLSPLLALYLYHISYSMIVSIVVCLTGIIFLSISIHPSLSLSLSLSLSHSIFVYLTGIISGAVLQLKDDFCLSCSYQEMVISAMLMGAIAGSLIGGESSNCFITTDS